MLAKSKSGRLIDMPTDEEDAAITAAALSDPDALPLTDEEWERVEPRLRRHHSPSSRPKVSTAVCFDADVLDALKATGPGWQMRINEIVREYVEAHQG